MQFGSGTEYHFTSSDDVDNFVAWAYEDIAAKTAQKAGNALPLPDPLTGLSIDALRYFAGSKYKPPPPVATYGELSAEGSAGAWAQLFSGGANGSLSIGGTVGYRRDSATGELTLYQQIDTSTLGSSGTMLVETTMDKNNKITRIGISGTMRFIHGALPAQHSSAHPQVRVAFESDMSSDNVA